MRTLGYLAAAVLVFTGVGVVIFLFMSLSDAKRYLKIRKM